LPLPPQQETPSRPRRAVKGVGPTHVDGEYSIHTNAARRIELLREEDDRTVEVLRQKTQEALAKVWYKPLPVSS